MDQIFKRTSIRRYLDQPVEAEKTEYLLKAAMQAPSAGNQQHGNSTSSRTGISWKNSPRSALMQGLPQGTYSDRSCCPE